MSRDTFTRDEVRDLLSQVALDFHKLASAGSSITDLNGAIETYLEFFEEEEESIECGQDFMAGTICSLPEGHDGPHGTTCQECGQDWYSEGHAKTCSFFEDDEEE